MVEAHRSVGASNDWLRYGGWAWRPVTPNYQFALDFRSTLARTQSSFDRSTRMQGAVYGTCAPQKRVECGSRVRRSLSFI